jgi:Ni/Co efflux regulator RcnB
VLNAQRPSQKENAMKNTSAIISALLAVTQACWMLEPANAQPGHAHQGQQQQREDRQAGRDMPYREGRHTPSYNGPVQIGSYFQSHHREAAQEYYGRPENRGYCPPGLAKKGGSCMPPGQARKWQRGHPLPAGLVYYEVPRSVVLTLGVPPSGYRYVRVASDILLLAVGTNMVVDAIEDLVR